MLATFCLRLALGMAGSMLVLPVADVAPRFYRVQFLVILGLLAGAVFFFWPSEQVELVALLLLALVLSFAGSIVCLLEGSPLGRCTCILTTLVLMAAAAARRLPWVYGFWPMLNEWMSAAVLGSATSAMLLGHSYLVAPGMSIQPLLRLLLTVGIAIGVRMVMAGRTLVWLLGYRPEMFTGDILLWLPVRWIAGFVAPLILCWMAWKCAKIRSTQSATGILYVVVVLVFIGELTSQALYWTRMSREPGVQPSLSVRASIPDP